jgi:hypothetical protein
LELFFGLGGVFFLRAWRGELGDKEAVMAVVNVYMPSERRLDQGGIAVVWTEPNRTGDLALLTGLEQRGWGIVGGYRCLCLHRWQSEGSEMG